jgi:hypothetical protein
MTVVAPAMVCTRCNKLSGEVGKCMTCGRRLESVQSMKRRGWLALTGGVLVIVLMTSVWIWVGGLLAAHGVVNRDPATAQFIGRTYVAFALVEVCGVLGIINGSWQIRSGRRNRVLAFAMLVLFAAAIGVAATGAGAYHPS